MGRQFGRNFHRICKAQTLEKSLNVAIWVCVRQEARLSDRRWLKMCRINGLSYLLTQVVCYQQTWRQKFLGSWSSTVERSSTRTATFLRFFQTIFENTPLWRLKRLVTLSTYRRYINKCIYLSIYYFSNWILRARPIDYRARWLFIVWTCYFLALYNYSQLISF